MIDCGDGYPFAITYSENGTATVCLRVHDVKRRVVFRSNGGVGHAVLAEAECGSRLEV